MSVNSEKYKPVGRGSIAPKQASKRYIPDLSSFMSLCDANYAKMMQLLPEFESCDERVFGLSRSSHELGDIRISIIERCKYTTTLEIEQLLGHAKSERKEEKESRKSRNSLLPEARMTVRLYHDAKMAEVFSYQGIGNLRASYAYPNESMMQKDEKELCNEFLADWLSYCLKFGHSQNSVSI